MRTVTQLTALYPEKYIYDVAGFPSISAKDLVDRLTEQMMQYHPTLVLNEKVTGLTTGPTITLTTASGRTHYTKAVLIAAGVGAFNPRKLDVKGIADYENRGLFYFVNNVSIFNDKRLLIVGGGDTSFDWSLSLYPLARSIVQIHRSDKYRAHEDTVAKVKSLPIDLKPFHEVKAVYGEPNVECVTIFDNRTKAETHIECDAILLSLGYLTNLGPIKEWGLDLAGNTIRVTSRMETNLPGVYAAGDIVDYPGKHRIIATGFSEAAIAVNHSKVFVDPTAKAFPGHSSESVPHKV
ncbi:MAG: NAD(P)/FAD-dependent oxidoreductase [Capsulimonadaceae bacterium]